MLDANIEADFIEGLEAKPGSVLDAGCGTGRVAPRGRPEVPATSSNSPRSGSAGGCTNGATVLIPALRRIGRIPPDSRPFRRPIPPG